MEHCLKLCDLVARACGVVPEVEAPEGSGWDCWTFGGGVCFGLVPEVDGVGDDRGLLWLAKRCCLNLVEKLEAVEVLEELLEERCWQE